MSRTQKHYSPVILFSVFHSYSETSTKHSEEEKDRRWKERERKREEMKRKREERRLAREKGTQQFTASRYWLSM